MMGFPAPNPAVFQHMAALSASSQQNYFPSVADSQAALPIQQHHLPAVSPHDSQVEVEQSNYSWNDAGVPDTSFLMSRPVSDAWSFDGLSLHDNNVLHSDHNHVPAESCYESITSSDEDAGPPTPNFLPIQQFDDLPAPAAKSDPESSLVLSSSVSRNGDELVGMGLYSEPDLIIEQHPAYGRTGKGLKLEETFTPSSENEDQEGDDEDGQEEEEEEEDGDDAEGDDVKESSRSGHVQPSTDMSQKSFLFDADEFDSASDGMAACQPVAATSHPAGVGYAYGWI